MERANPDSVFCYHTDNDRESPTETSTRSHAQSKGCPVADDRRIRLWLTAWTGGRSPRRRQGTNTNAKLCSKQIGSREKSGATAGALRDNGAFGRTAVEGRYG